MHGFPNLFIVGLSQGANLISNITHNLTEAGTTIAAVVGHALDVGADEVEVTAEAEQAWVALLESSTARVPRQPRLHARLLQQRGQADRPQRTLNGSGYPAARSRTSQYIDDWRSTGDVRRASSSGSPALGQNRRSLVFFFGGAVNGPATSTSN